MEFRDIEYISAIVKSGSVSHAAEQLLLTQPALSGYIKKMEQRLGASIFNRVGKKMILTRLGEKYYTDGQDLLFLRQRLENEIDDMIKNNRGRLRIGLPLLRGISLLPQILPAFRVLYPNVEVVLFEEDASRLDKLIVSGDVDFAIFNRPINNVNMDYRLISHEEIVLCTHRNDPLIREAQQRPECKYPWLDLQKCQDALFILNYPEQRTTQIAQHLFQTAGFKPHVVLRLRSLMTSVSLSAAGVGMCFSSEKYPTAICIGPQPVIFSVGSPITYMNLVAAYRRGSHLTKYAQDFIRLTQELY